MRPRKQDRHLPACLYLKHGSYWLVKQGKWRNLGQNYNEALQEYAILQAQPAVRKKRHAGTDRQGIECTLKGIS